MATFNIVLNSTLKKSSRTTTLNFSTFPTFALDIKKEVERQFSIPICIQTLAYQSTVLDDMNPIDPIHVRSGDTFHITYQTEGSCTDTVAVIDWLKKLRSALQGENASDQVYLRNDIDRVIYEGMVGSLARYLSLDLFYPWSDDSKLVNKYHFEVIGGLDVLVAVYSMILQLEWSTLSYRLKYMECICVQSLANFTQTFSLRRSVLKCGGLELCLKSLMRKMLLRGARVTDDGDAMTSHTELLQCDIEIGLYAICK